MTTIARIHVPADAPGLGDVEDFSGEEHDPPSLLRELRYQALNVLRYEPNGLTTRQVANEIGRRRRNEVQDAIESLWIDGLVWQPEHPRPPVGLSGWRAANALRTERNRWFWVGSPHRLRGPTLTVLVEGPGTTTVVANRVRLIAPDALTYDVWMVLQRLMEDGMTTMDRQGCYRMVTP